MICGSQFQTLVQPDTRDAVPQRPKEFDSSIPQKLGFRTREHLYLGNQEAHHVQSRYDLHTECIQWYPIVRPFLPDCHINRLSRTCAERERRCMSDQNRDHLLAFPVPFPFVVAAFFPFASLINLSCLISSGSSPFLSSSASSNASSTW